MYCEVTYHCCFLANLREKTGLGLDLESREQGTDSSVDLYRRGNIYRLQNININDEGPGACSFTAYLSVVPQG